MPRMTVETGNLDKVEVTVRGRSLADLRVNARYEAARFFGVDAEESVLKLSGMFARPVITDAEGLVSLYKCTVVVTYQPEEEDEIVVRPRRRSPGPESEDDELNTRDDLDEDAEE